MDLKSWTVKKLENVATLQRGFDLPNRKRIDGDVPIISSAGTIGCHKQAMVNGPGVVTGRYGSIGEMFYVDKNFWPLNTTLWVKDFHNNDEKYVYYLLSSLDFKKFSDKTGVPGVNRNDLHKIKVVLAPKECQKPIVNVLEIWEIAIAKTEQLIAAKEKQFDWFMKKYINEKCDAWEHLKMEELFESISIKNNPGEVLLSVTQDRGVIPRTMLEGRVMSPKGSTDSYKLVESGNFVISLRSFQGGLEYSQYRGIVSPAYTVLTNKLPLCEAFYIHFFKSHIFINKYLRKAVIGIRDGRQVSFPDLQTVRAVEKIKHPI